MQLQVDKALIQAFEQQLDPLDVEASGIPARLLGFGEISCIIELEAMPGVVLKRMPLFRTHAQAADYLDKYRTYCRLLQEAGLALPADEAVIVDGRDGLVVLYFLQEKLDLDTIGNRQLDRLDEAGLRRMLLAVVEAIEGVWAFNARQDRYRLALDAQLSNWAWQPDEGRLLYLDTSTPLFRIDGVEQLDPELLLASAPGFARAIIRAFFLDDVMNRYYDAHAVYVDLVANLYKEKHPELIPLCVQLINERTGQGLTEKEIADYYREDKFIWSLFLAMRRLDRWLHRHVWRRQYQFILPGRIER